MYVAIVDTETTGVARDDEAISVGILLLEVEAQAGRLVRRVGHYLGYREPRKAIHPAAARVHGLTREQLAGQAFDVSEMNRLISQANVLIAHNAKFDARMLLSHVPLVTEKEWRCSWRQIRWPASLPNEKLDSICAYFGFDRPNPHNALLDCGSLADCLLSHSGKTTRSYTYLGKLLNESDYRSSLNFDATEPVQNVDHREQRLPEPSTSLPIFAPLSEDNVSLASADNEREPLDKRLLTFAVVIFLCSLGALLAVAVATR